MTVLRHKNKNRTSRLGFSAIELLVVIAIIAILAALAIPSISSMQNSLKSTELDGAARSIFIAAQNHMSNMRDENYEVLLDDAIPMGAKPSDFPTSLSWETGEYYYLGINARGMEKLLPTASIDQTLWDGMFYIEYNSKSGMIYAVFYSEESLPFYTSSLPRDALGRKDHSPRLGYYGGANIDLKLLDTLEAPEFLIIDDDKSLRIEFTSNPLDKLKFALEITGGGKTVKYNDIYIDDMTKDNITVEGSLYTIILDKPVEKFRFRELFPGITPGANLEITLSVSSMDALPASTKQTVNSLFASRSGETVMIKNMRHLQNLHVAHSQFRENVKVSFSAPIDAKGFYDNGYTFTTILTSYVKTYNGNGNTITGLKVPLFDVIDGYTINSLYLVNPKINVVVTTGTVRVGALANQSKNSVITNCGVYATATGYDAATIESSGAAQTGGLIGHAGGTTFTRCFASLNLIRASSGDTGGLVGRGDGSAFSFCYADTGFWTATGWHRGADGNVDVGLISGGGNVGGFSGSANGGRFENCYSVGALNVWGGNAASFICGAGAATFSNCYGAMKYADFTDANKLNGFTLGKTVTPGNCYYLKDSNVSATNNLITYTELTEGMNQPGWCAGESNTTYAYGLEGAQLPFPSFLSVPHYGDWEESSPKIYYYEKYEDLNGEFTYGFHTRYADVAETTTLLERDRLNSGDIWIIEDGYALMSDSLVAGEKLEVSYGARKAGDSYSKTYKETLTAEVVLEQGSKHKLVGFFIRPDAEMKQGILETIYMETYSVGETTRRYYASITAAGKKYYFMPLVAKGANNGLQGTGSHEIAGVLEIRTSRQLWELARRSNYSFMTSTHYKQTVNIDFSKYSQSDKYQMVPVGSLRGGSYDGEYNIITGTNIDFTGTSKQNGGLFAEITLNSVVKNVFLISDSPGGIPRQIKGGTGSTGGIAGSLTGGATVENCVVSGFDIIGDGNVGGIAGSFLNNNTTIKNCAVVCFETDDCDGGSLFSSGGSTANIGGIVGITTHSNFINTTYAIVSIPGSCNAQSTGLIGSVANWTNLSVTDCYGYVIKGDNFLFGAPGTTPLLGNNVKYKNVLQYDGVTDLDWTIFTNNITPGITVLSPKTENTFTTCPVLAGEKYPYASFVKNSDATTGNRVHFGNWFHASTAAPVVDRLYYFEKYTGDKYGYSYGEYDTLRDDLEILEDGYALLLDATGAPDTAEITAPYGNAATAPKTIVTIDGKTYAAYYFSSATNLSDLLKLPPNTGSPDLPSSALMEAAITAGSKSITSYFNPHFANTVSDSPTRPEAYEVRTARHLLQLNLLTNRNIGLDSCWGGEKFIQTRDIDFSGYNSFVPICGSMGNGFDFKGIYDGGGYSITNLNLKNIGVTSSSIGLFGIIDTGGVVKNVNIKNSSLTAGIVYCGMVAGNNKGLIEDCTVDGATIDLGLDTYTGGLVGFNSGTIKGCKVINSSIKPDGNNGAVGGFVGGTESTSIITNCSVENVALDSKCADLGGFIGHNKGKISFSAALSGSVFTNYSGVDSIVGGFIGANDGLLAIVENCFAAGQNVAGFSLVGGFSGVNNGGTIKYCAAANGDFESASAGGGLTVGDGAWGAGAKGRCGGFVSRNSGTIEYCYAMSRLIKRPPAGGNDSIYIAAFFADNSGTINNIYYAAIDTQTGNYLKTNTGTGIYPYDGTAASFNSIISAFNSGNWSVATAANTHPYNATLSGIAYPFPAIVKDAKGAYIHYGNWPKQ